MPLSSESAIMFPDSAAFSSPISTAAAVPLFTHVAPAKWKRKDGSCIDVMRATSPPRSWKSNDGKALSGEAAYSNWLLQHPSVLSSFEDFMQLARGKKFVLFLDYDGTLSPIVENPDQAFMASEMRDAVKEVARLLPTSIITGRSREKVYEFVQLPELFYAGSHGMDIMGPANSVKVTGTQTEDREGNEVIFFQPASSFLPTINEAYKDLEKRMRFIAGARVEDNKFCISVHFRQVNEEDWQFLAEEVQQVLNLYPALTLTHGRKVLEIRPSIKWDKGKAVEFLLGALDLGDDVMAVYIGDDQTDEDAFNMLKDKFNGYGILVSNIPKSTSAAYSLQDTSEVQEFLKQLVRYYSW